MLSLVAKSRGIKTLGIIRRKEAVDIALKAGADVVLIDDENVVTAFDETQSPK